MPKASTKKTGSARKLTLALLFSLLALVFLFSALTTSTHELVRIKNQDEELVALVADTDVLREKGLAYRRALGAKQGMLFVFDQPGRYGIWMKDMTFPIDIIWLDENKRIVSIKENAEPANYPETYVPEVPAQYVLEVRSGQAKALKLTAGTQLSW